MWMWYCYTLEICKNDNSLGHFVKLPLRERRRRRRRRRRKKGKRREREESSQWWSKVQEGDTKRCRYRSNSIIREKRELRKVGCRSCVPILYET